MRARTLLLVIVALLLAGCGGASTGGGAPTAGPAAGGTPTRVSVALDWTPNTNHTGVYVAQQQGWYAAEGLEVQILPYAAGNAPDVQVGAGRADFGFSFTEAVTVARAADRPVVSLAAVIQKATSAFVTLKDSGLDRPAKLEGRRYAGFGAPFEEPVIETVITCDGGRGGRVENITTNVFGFQALVAKQADFVWIFQGWEGVAARRANVELNAFPPTDFCVPNYYTPVIITNERMIAERAEVVRRFMRATARGYEYAVSNPAEAAELLIKAAPPGSFPDPGLVRDSAQWLAPKYKEGKARWGEQDLQVWTDYPRFMIRSGRLKDGNGQAVSRDLDYARFFTNEFLPR
jgi:ABC-type nitrate/sulfonate/bicarbonate transport system substrate-binding protein